MVAIIWVALFVGMFANMTLDTFNNNIIMAHLAVVYDDDPSLAALSTTPS